ncbi:hypothetical protein [Arenicella xantha]|uniref:Uncharacterized protein n=1 Tax=Arenicella xantha TaxID=644221 RepID=A0A395JU77_9GAMM|nr:hypothetical protein [Arenicella xantha]RBP53098.1 hypothetical protein DFR28_101483 [Arenicella xantha]
MFKQLLSALVISIFLSACGDSGTQSGGIQSTPVPPVDPVATDFAKFSDAYDIVGKAQDHPKIIAALDLLKGLEIPEYAAVARHLDRTYLAKDLRSVRDNVKLAGVYHYRHIALDIDYIQRINKIRVAGLLVHEARHANRPYETEEQIDLHESRVVALLGGTEEDIRIALAKQKAMKSGN